MSKPMQKVKQQEQIMAIEDKNLIVSASAGSGKTTVMIRKILKYIIDQKCHVDELLVLTYTKSAASEMKKKLIDKIKDNIEKNPSLAQELEQVQTADICTFDSFCQKLIKKYFYILNIDPVFNILEGSDKFYVQGVCIKQAINELKATNPQYYEILLNYFSPRRDEEKIKEIIFEIYSYTTSLLNIDEFYKKSLNLYKKDKKIAENYLNSYYLNIFSGISANLNYLINKCEELNFTNYIAYINNLLSICDRFLCNNNFCSKVDFFDDVDYKRLDKEDKDEIGLNKIISKQKEILKNAIDKIKQTFVSCNTIKKSYEDINEILVAIITLVKLFENKYAAQKNSKDFYDFNDIERLTIKLLENQTAQEEIKNSYKYIFVDEFQDANSVQEKIINLLQNNNLFFVGDTKQSIYAFRQSDPEIFLSTEKRFKKDKNSASKVLNSNFRTNKNILNFVNKIFSVIMTKETCGIDYLNTAQFDPRANYNDLENEICVSVNLINKEKENNKFTPTEVYNLKDKKNIGMIENKNKEECIFICSQILELLGKEIYDPEIEANRKLSFKDFTILLAKRGEFLKVLTQTLSSVGIPYIASTTDNLEDVYDNLVLYNLLKYSLNKNDDYSLYSILTSALFNFTDNELAYIKSKNSQFNNFYEAFENFNDQDQLGKKIECFKLAISEFIFNINHRGIFYALNQILIKTNYLLNISFEEDFQTRKNNVEQYINSFCNSKYNYNLAEYIFIREISTREEKVEQVKTSIDAVEISTMHSSKGLEYPVVILPNLDDDFFRSPKTSEIKINKELGIGIKAYNQDDRSQSNGIFYEACKLKNKELEQSEKIRLLYVAMTRAKNKLILVGYNSKNYDKFTDNQQIMSTNNYLSFIVNSLDKQVIDQINTGEEFSLTLYNNDRIVLNAINIVVDDISCEKLTIPSTADNKIIDEVSTYLQKDLSWQSKNIALKNSVSSVAYDDNSSINFAPKELNISEHLSEKASDIGTLYHSLLEIINFNEVNSIADVQQFIECNFNNDEINIFKNISYENIFKNIKLIKTFINNHTVLKEQKFVMNIPYNEITNNTNIKDKVLVQGIIDALLIKDDEIILLDYKLSSKTNESIKKTYHKQLSLYETAIKKGFTNYKIKKYIINLTKSEIIDMN